MNDSASKVKLSIPKTMLTLTMFIILWLVLTDAWGYSARIFGDAASGGYIWAVLSRLIWVLPAVFLFYRFGNRLAYPPADIFAPKFHIRATIIGIVAVAIYVFAMMFVYHGGFWVNTAALSAFVIIKLLTVSIVEETVFRAWGYNALLSAMGSKKAILLSTFFFTLLHWSPFVALWYQHGVFDWSGAVFQSITAIIWGVVLCVHMKMSKSIWFPILIHFLFDYMAILFMGAPEMLLL
jgi:membrane protease YdiL (CAAX protease family)